MLSFGYPNNLILSEDKTEAQFFCNKITTFPLDRPVSVLVGDADIPLVSFARDLGYTITVDMSLDKHVVNLFREPYYELISIRYTLSIRTTKIFIVLLFKLN